MPEVRAESASKDVERADVQLPDLATLTSVLTSLTNGSIRRVVDRTDAFFAGTYPNEIVTCEFADGRRRQLFCKYSAGGGPNGYGHRGSVVYEALVYDKVLTPMPITVPRFIGAYEEPSGGIWLFLECMPDIVPLTWEWSPQAFLDGARWAGSFHTLGRPRMGDETGFLTRYDADYYRGWAERTSSFAADWHTEFPWLASFCRGFEESIIPMLVESEQTVIHGEFYGKNILRCADDICVVDWESTAVGPGEIDLAALTEGCPPEIVESCAQEYARARWPQGPPTDHDNSLHAARIYMNLRWTGDRPEWTQHPHMRWRFEQVRAAGERLGLL